MTGDSHPRRRLLVVIASYGTNQDRYLERLVQEYRTMSYAVDIVVVSNAAKPVPEGVELVVGLPTRDPWSLPFAHKRIMADRVNDYDLFVYSENDTQVSETNIEAFLRVSEALPSTEIPGFLRYENGPQGSRNYISLHGHYHWDPSSPCRYGPYTFAFLTNEHAACYVLTQQQLRRAIDSGGFLVPPHKGKYDLACSASTDPYTRCGFRKLICVSHLEEFLVHHLPDKYTGADFDPIVQGFEKQLNVLLTIGNNGKRPSALLETETKLPAALYSKDYYEPVRPEVVGEVPGSVRSILSIGCGSGETERWWAARGVKVTAVPLDPVIGACLEGSEIEVVPGNFAAARQQLEGRTFDCLFLSNIVHLLADPQEALRQFAELLGEGGFILLVSPNLNNLKQRRDELMKDRRNGQPDTFQVSGVQRTSRRRIEEWFRGAGCKVENVKWITMTRFRNLGRFVPAAFREPMSAEMIVLGRRATR